MIKNILCIISGIGYIITVAFAIGFIMYCELKKR